jgi:hypothetical protein
MHGRRGKFIRAGAATAVLTLVAASSLAAGSPRMRLTSDESDPRPYRYWEDPYAGPFCGGPCGGGYCCNISVLAPNTPG